MHLAKLFGVPTVIATLALAAGCGNETVERDVVAVEEAAATLEENVERSAKVMEETYEAERAAGEGRVEAAGTGYNAVLEEANEKKKEQP